MADSIDDLLTWPILAGLGLNVLTTVSKAHVFDNGRHAVIVDVDDCVYYITSTNKGEISRRSCGVLSGQKICAMAVYGGHRVVVSEAGLLYGWGHSKRGELIQVKDSRIALSEAVKLDQLAEHKFVKVVCGCSHSVALSDEGEVWAWGYNTYAQCSGIASYEPKPPHLVLPDTFCSDIVSGDTASAALTRRGVVWMWGSNTHGERGLPGDAPDDPNKVALPSRVIRIAMGAAHVLALTEQGQMFAWGKNDRGQIGNGDIGTEVKRPEFLDCRLNRAKIKFVDIAAMANTSAALSDDQVVYFWGHCSGGVVTPEKYHQSTPVRTVLRNLSEAIARHVGWGTYRTLVIQDDPVSRDIAAAFDNEQLSDCRFSVEGKVIFAQKAVLQNRSQYFQAMFSVDWKESSSGTIYIGHHCYPSYKALIKYLYTGKMDIPDGHLLPLMRLCHETIHEKLGKMCMERMRRQLSAKNIVNVLDVAMELQLQPLLGYCREFAKSNVKRIMKAESTENGERLKRLCAFAFDGSSSESD